jgi:hypothetical protein
MPKKAIELKPIPEDTCAGCGTPLVNSITKRAGEELHHFGKLPYCVKCTASRYQIAKNRTGSAALAAYFNCMYFDIPYHPEVFANTVAVRTNKWESYLDNLRKGGLNFVGDRVACFNDGTVDMLEAVGENAPPIYDNNDDPVTQREKWDRDWGNDVDNSVCAELDRTYQMLASEYKGGITPRMDLALRDIANLRMKRDNALKAPDGSADAKRYQDMIDKIMSGEAMKAGDSKPLETARIDSIIDALERKGMVKNGKIIPRDQLLRLLARERNQYNTPRDVVDSMMFAIINTMKRNNGEQDFSVLPVEAQVQDPLNELPKKMSERDKKLLSDLGMSVPVKEKREKK